MAKQNPLLSKLEAKYYHVSLLASEKVKLFSELTAEPCMNAMNIS